jgi:hypothetical protein
VVLTLYTESATGLDGILIRNFEFVNSLTASSPTCTNDATADLSTGVRSRRFVNGRMPTSEDESPKYGMKRGTSSSSSSRTLKF